ncbi:Gcv operon repressor [Pantoea agglomerans]|uniref:Gcv operon repressor n=1 Tax=Enterobacter agglomerans TaxID=549 RepID=A0A379ADG5_ENTAG|nr:Gcv operon repressor [Pantoea agglomerans]
MWPNWCRALRQRNTICPPTLYIQMTAHSPTRTSGTPFEQAFNTLCQELNAQGTLRLYSVSDADSSESVSAVR